MEAILLSNRYRMIISLSRLARELKVTSPDLITRPMGRSFFKKVASRLSCIQDGETILLDFEDIRVVDSSFIAEFIMKLIFESQSNTQRFYVKLSSLSDTTIMNIESVFKSYHSMNNSKIAVITDELINNSYAIGQVSDKGKDIINYLNINKSASAVELASFLQEESGYTAQLLEELHSLGLVKTETGRNTVLYCAI
ncbi:MAG TPA: DUF4325 domain-containing protein [Spirochaetota bacterium]|nr:DUF4325 domain-containing protein [Spirochaetota bacterium]